MKPSSVLIAVLCAFLFTFSSFAGDTKKEVEVLYTRFKDLEKNREPNDEVRFKKVEALYTAAQSECKKSSVNSPACAQAVAKAVAALNAYHDSSVDAMFNENEKVNTPVMRKRADAAPVAVDRKKYCQAIMLKCHSTSPVTKFCQKGLFAMDKCLASTEKQ